MAKRPYDYMRDDYQSALDAMLANDTPYNVLAEQIAWDALIDFVEESGLNYTKDDPRGTE